ncbi:hypothetical protein [Bifidobacterium tibiigranuli]|uniref:hypothetical protein n=1 Tax=Bifidobacterium tibiigranuli TaxID=2172043 RepID=UPI0026EACCE2|nr:hypothetical protein [Bifidobacterium tibiigranuli]MCI1649446.1 hypothetical protein [Bifidobacterium tibiigranuli]MCI1833932.1 hypothetical protein [Bifidobacterium tibiigranuli]MCI2186192.1 hypothetical protein [Bifidobacterium tibiigranuli]MCI2203981.1 hypothetical protein [Bifidobacterium tibiigranuli]
MEEREADDACIRYWAALAQQPQPRHAVSGGLDGLEAMRLTAPGLGAGAQPAQSARLAQPLPVPLPQAATSLRLRHLP